MAAYTLKKCLAHKDNYGTQRKTSDIKYIVIHYTANDGDTDENNALYFQRNIKHASAHYFVDNNSVTQSVPDDYVAYSVGGSKYANCSTTGGGKLYNKCTNANSISVELCDPVKDGTVYAGSATITNALALVKDLMKKYNVPVSNVIRHFDVTGKACPAYWCGTTSKDAKWLSEFRDKLQTTTTTKTETLYRIRKTWSDAASQIGAYSSLDNAKKNCKEGYNVYDSKGEIVYSNVTQMYRIRKTWKDSASQIGAYKSLDNAKKNCKSGYSVFDESGKAVYSVK